MKKILIGGGLSLFALALSFNVAFAASLQNGSFETGTDPGVFATLNAGDTNIDDWTVASGSVDYIGSYWSASQEKRSIDMNGLAAGSLKQNIATQVGALYTVAFDLSGNPDKWQSNQPIAYQSLDQKVINVSATGALSKDFTYDTATEENTLTNMKWKAKTYSFIATGTSTTLEFTSKTAGAFGPALDNVVVTETVSPPASLNSPTNKDQCKNGGWKDFTDPEFKNQGQCVSWITSRKLIQTIQVSAENNTGIDSAILKDGKKYLFEASGTYKFANWTNAGTADSMFSLRLPGFNNPYSVPMWINGDVFPSPVQNWLKLWADGPVSWVGSYVDHNYSYVYDGAGSPVHFSIMDDAYGDNVGGLTVNIYEMPKL